MKVALIPPIPMLSAFGSGGFHLLLTHLLEDEKYLKHYIQERQNGAYLVLDNSAHEKGEGEDAASLMASAIKLHAQEVVVPDVLFDAEKTVDKAVHAHQVWYEAGHSGMIDLNPALMYVPQGEKFEDWFECCRDLLRLHFYAARRHAIRRTCVLGISKDYEMWHGGLVHVVSSIIPVLSHWATLGMNVHIHMLGWGRDLWGLGAVRRSYPWIRSTDSAKPFVYALSGIELDPDKPAPEYPTRPKNYFSKKLTVEQMQISQRNIDVFRRLAG